MYMYLACGIGVLQVSEFLELLVRVLVFRLDMGYEFAHYSRLVDGLAYILELGLKFYKSMTVLTLWGTFHVYVCIYIYIYVCVCVCSTCR